MTREWATAYDIFDPAYVADPFPIWDDLRARCPIAHSDEHGGSWLPTRYDDVAAIAHDVEHFSSRNVSVIAPVDSDDDLLPDGLPPISADPPQHTWSRRLLLPWFSHKRVAEYEVGTRALWVFLVLNMTQKSNRTFCKAKRVGEEKPEAFGPPFGVFVSGADDQF